MKHTGKLTVLLGALALAIIVPISAQSSTETLKVGVITSEEIDNDSVQGALLAATQINNGDDDDIAGIAYNDNEYELEIVTYSAETQDEAVDAYDDAIADNVVAIIAPNDKSLTQSILDERTPEVPFIALTADAPDSTEVTAISATYDTWATVAADYLATERLYSRVAVVSTNTTSASAATETFREALGLTPVLDTVVEADASNFSGIARDIRSANAQAVFIWTLDAQSVALINALADTGWDGVIVVAGLSETSANSITRNDVYVLRNWSVSATDATSESFINDYTAETGIAPSSLSAAAYDSLYLLSDAISRAGDTPSSIQTQLNASDIVGVQGTYTDGQTQGVRLVEIGAQVIEAAVYNEGACSNCPDLWRADTSEDSVANNATFDIGLMASTESVIAAQGESIEQAVRLAIREINALGGVVNGDTRYTLNLQVYAASDVASADTALQQATQDGVQIVLGPDSNAQVLTTTSIVDGVQLVSASSSQIALTAASNNIVQLRPNDDALLNALSDYLLNTLDQTRFAFVAARTDYGLDALDNFAEIVDNADDGELLLSLEHDLDHTDFADFAQRIVDANVESVVVWTTQPAAQSLLVALDAFGWQGTFAYGYVTPDFLAANDTAINVTGAVNWWATAMTWAGMSYANAYDERYSEIPTPQSVAYYDAVYMIANALETEGADTAAIRDALNALTQFNGAQGTYTDYGTGELTRSVTLIAQDGDNATVLARYDGTTCLSGCE